jgi:tRNA threonylcarbamoyladenosine biosynthesis protein TsaB
MAYLLCLETATQVCSVALYHNNQPVILEEQGGAYNHASLLTPMIDSVLKKAGLLPKDLSAVAVSKGPGSYTGLRVGCSTAKGLCYGLDIPLIGIDTLKSMAVVGLQSIQCLLGDVLMPMIDARRMEVYTAAFDTSLNNLIPTDAVVVSSSSFPAVVQSANRIFYFGDGASKCKDVLPAESFFFVDGITCSAAGMGVMAFEKYTAHQFEDIAYFEPYYLKDFGGAKKTGS